MKKFLIATVPFLNSRVRFYPVSYVATIIESAGWKCDYLDLNRVAYDHGDEDVQAKWDADKAGITESVKASAREVFAEALRDARVDEYAMVGLSLYPSCQQFTTVFLEALRDVGYRGVSMFGGPDCFPANYGSEYMAAEVCPDILLQGESEIVFPEFLKQFEETGSYRTELPGFLYKDDEGRLVDTGEPTKPKPRHLDIVADGAIYGDGYAPLINTFTSRGCINKCSFCSEWRNFNPLRRRSAESVVKEIASQKQRMPNSNNVWLLDSNFNTSKKHVVEFCEALIRENLGLTWKTMGCFRIDLDEDTLKLMKRSGFTEMMIGFESASQVVLDYMGKNYDSNYAQVIVSRFNEAGIDVRLPIMNGFPGESTSDFLATCAFILRYTDSEGVYFSYSNTCYVFENTMTCDYPHDFCINETNLIGAHWQQCDGMNTFPVRQLRRSIAMHLIKRAVSKNFDVDNLLLSLDFNKPDMAIELLRLVQLIAMANDNMAFATEFVQSVISSAAPSGLEMPDRARYSMLCRRVSDFDAVAWLAADKNGESKKAIIQHIYSELDRLGSNLDKTSHIDCKAFKNGLYPEEAKKADPRECAFEITSTRSTEYDSGQFIILEGVTWDGRKNVPASAVWARTGENVVEFHYGMANAEFTPSDDLFNTTFWGKIKKSYIHGEVQIVVQMDDGTCYSNKVLLDT